MYKEGDKIKIKSYKDIRKIFKDNDHAIDGVYFLDSMKDICGMTLTIASEYKHSFTGVYMGFKVKEFSWTITDKMIEDTSFSKFISYI